MIAHVGASGWDYFVPYTTDMAGALRDLQRDVFAADEFFWYDDDDPYPAPKPTTLEELDAIKQMEEFWDVGTHSILDLDRVIGPGDEDHDGTLRLMAPAEAERVFGSPMPTRAQFEAAYQGGMGDVPFARKWGGLYLVLADENGQPAEIAIWGYSGD
jgi:hypothetical protein